MDKKIKQQVFEKYDGRCAYCGCKLEGGWQIDHIIPQSHFQQKVKNGRVPEFLKHLTICDCNHIDNLFPACHSCNNYKGGYDLEEFRELILDLFKKPEYLFKSKTKMNIALRHGLMRLPEWDKVFHFEMYKLKLK